VIPVSPGFVARPSLLPQRGVGGGYISSSEVVRDALRLLQHDKALEREKLAILRREINLGLDAASAGRFSTQSVSDIADEVRREHSG
jgi:antitoxin ParD1/3/4